MGNASFSSATTAFQAAVSSSENEGTPASKGRPPLRMHNAPLKTAVVHDGFSPATATSGYLASDDEQRLPPWVKAKAGDRSHSQQAKKTLPTELPQPSTSTPIQNSTRPSNYHYKVEAQISQLTDNMAKEPRQSDLFALIYKCTTSLDRLHLRAQGNAHAHEAVTALGRALEALSASISQCKEDEGNEEGWQWIENHEDLFYSLQRNLFKIYTLTLDSTTFELDRLQAYEEKLQSLTKKLNKSHYRLTLQRLRSRLRAEHETAREEARDEEMRRAEFRIKWEEGKATRAALRRELAIIDMEKAPEARSERPRRRTRGKGDV
ncbi:hypothetical protein BJ138DRAFT_1112105 [Hygrophoropsis aurantiaca]|uniref:Uncharacterized protein n=1 Tax=Hygrophoropsis aurantiaca TaxID=72124 RepID=A0ACB8AHJ8_9AGAM|nr:hypothetical protein BJ138DRAFT_1112105 [Hygrophoropsis aurantiaca]